MTPARWLGGGLVAASLTLVAAACSVGTGSGELAGHLLLADCAVDIDDYHLRPTFFGAEYVTTVDATNGENAPAVTLRVQRGSYRESQSDGILVVVHDVNTIVREHLGEPITLTQVHRDRERSLVDVTLYAGQSCDAGYPDSFWRVPGILHANGGTVVFHSLHAPDLDRENTEFFVELNDVTFASTESPTRRNASLSGFFRFFYQRGAPAQTFP